MNTLPSRIIHYNYHSNFRNPPQPSLVFVGHHSEHGWMDGWPWHVKTLNVKLADNAHSEDIAKIAGL